MNLFDNIVKQVLNHQPNLSPLKIVVEKELLHHDILRILSHNDFLNNLTFIGGTCLRSCYGNNRLSEDLDFNGGADFTKNSLSELGQVLIKNLHDKYDLPIEVSEPLKEKSNVDTWKIKVQTRPQQKNIPNQRINIDICSVPSYEKIPMVLLNHYNIDMGTSGLIIHAQSREEIYTDKLIAFAFRPNRIKYRDLWDILWLHQQGLKPKFELIPLKLRDRHHTLSDFLTLFENRKTSLNNPLMETEFRNEMKRFLEQGQINIVLNQKDLWVFINYLINDLFNQIKANL